jgi:putative transposase
MRAAARLSLVDRADPVLSIVAQCRLLKVARSTLYHRRAPVSEDDLAVMRRLDDLYLATPFYGCKRSVSGVLSGMALPPLLAAWCGSAAASHVDRGDFHDLQLSA